VCSSRNSSCMFVFAIAVLISD